MDKEMKEKKRRNAKKTKEFEQRTLERHNKE